MKPNLQQHQVTGESLAFPPLVPQLTLSSFRRAPGALVWKDLISKCLFALPIPFCGNMISDLLTLLVSPLIFWQTWLRCFAKENLWKRHGIFKFLGSYFYLDFILPPLFNKSTSSVSFCVSDEDIHFKRHHYRNISILVAISLRQMNPQGLITLYNTGEKHMLSNTTIFIQVPTLPCIEFCNKVLSAPNYPPHLSRHGSSHSNERNNPI
jgi:hypothetical protein